MRARTIGAILLGIALFLPAGAQADEVQDAVTKLLAERTAGQLTVEFDVKKTDGTGGRKVSLQGLLVSADGLVLVTQANQVDPQPGSGNAKPEDIKVEFPGEKKVGATFVGKDDEQNLALLRIEKDDLPENLVPLTFDPDAAMTPGQQLVMLKRLGKADEHMVPFHVVRVSTVIPRPGLPTEYRVLGGWGGMMGCPVYTLDARLAGFLTQGNQGRASWRMVNGRFERVPAPDGGGPTRILDARAIAEFIADPKRFERRDSWLGVAGIQALSKELAEAFGLEKPGGLIFGKISEKSPAEAAGLKPGDVLVSLDGKPVDAQKDKDIASFKRTVRRAKAGERHTLKILRSGEGGYKEHLFEVAFEEAPLKQTEVPDYHDKDFGLKLKPLTRDFLESNRLPLDSKGVRVTWVEPAGWASIAGIRAGDVINKLVLKPCPDLDAYKAIMADLMRTRDSEVCYNVTRARKSLFVCVRPDWSTIELTPK